MACQIKRNADGTIAQVLAPNGKPSMLYDTLKSKLNNFKFKQVVVMDDYVSLVVNSEYIRNTNNEELALAAWSKAYTKEFINSFGDWKTKKLPNTDINSEPDVDSLFDVRTVIEENLTAETVRELSYMMQGKTDTNYKLINDKDRLFISRIEDSQVTVNIANVTPNTNVYDVFGYVVLASVKKNNPTLYNNLIDVTKTNQKVKSKDYRYKLSKGEFHTTSDKNQAARAQKNLDYVLGRTTEEPPYISGIGYIRFKNGELYTYKSALNLGYDQNGIKLDIKETTDKLQSIIDEAKERYLYNDDVSATIQEESMLELLNLYNTNQLEDKAEIRLAKKLLKEIRSFIQKTLPQKDLNQLPENLRVNDITGLLFPSKQITTIGPATFDKQLNTTQPAVKEGIDFVFEQNPELANIGTQEQYSEYLDTIFPESKVKDIVYHGSLSKFQNFIKNVSKRTTSSDGIWFTSSKELAKEYSVSEKIVHIGTEYEVLKKLKKENPFKNYKITSGFDADNYNEIIKKYGERKVNNGVIVEIESLGIVYPVIINSQNLKIIDGKGFNQFARDREIEIAKSENKDTVIITDTVDTISNNYELRSNTYTVFEPEQIHILGSKQDIEGFKKFVKGTQQVSGMSSILNLINMKRWTQTKNNCPQL